MLEECESKNLPNFLGIYARGFPSQVPENHFVNALNLNHNEPGLFGIRPGTSLYTKLTTAGYSIVDAANWVDAKGIVHLVHFDSSGNVFVDNNLLGNLGVPVVRVNSAIFFGRLFMCPIQPVGSSIFSYLTMLYLKNGIVTLRTCGGDPPVQTAQMVATVATGPPTSANTTSNPTTGTQTGNQKPDWVNIPNALTQSGNTSCTLYAQTGENVSNNLVFQGFGFTLPSNATIQGVQVNVPVQQTAGTSQIYDNSVYLLGTASTVNKAHSYSWPPYYTLATETYGSSTDLWTTTISPAEVNSPNFGFSISASCTLGPGNGATAAVFQPSMTVYYTAPATTGNIQAGTYNITIAYVTDTGFYTPAAISPSSTTQITTTATGSSVTLSNIPVGPSYVTGRLILVSYLVAGQPTLYYIVPDSDIAPASGNPTMSLNNTATSATLNFFNTDLVNSADYLIGTAAQPADERARIPSGQTIEVYAGRLVLGNFLYDTTEPGSNGVPDRTSLRISAVGLPETFQQTLETVVVEKDDGYNIANLAIIRDVLFIWKTKGIYCTWDNGSDPVNWSVLVTDQGFGAGIWGVSTVSPTVTRGMHSNTIIGADVSGIYLFDGTVYEPEISYKIKDLWDASVGDASTINVVGDVRNKRVFVYGFNTGPLQNMCLVGDVTEGVLPQTIKWNIWSYFNNVRIFIDVPAPPTLTTSTPLTCARSLTNNMLIWLDVTKFTDYVNSSTTQPINHFAVLGGQEFGDGIMLYRALRLKANGVGLLHITIAGEGSADGTPLFNVNDLFSPILLKKVTRELQSYSKFVSEKGYIKFEAQPANSTLKEDVGAYFEISKVTLYGLSFYAERPA